MATAFIAGYTPNTRTRLVRDSNVRSSLSESGTLRFVDLASTTYWRVTASFGPLTESERNTLENWLATNETDEIILPVGSYNYTGYINPEAGIRVEPYDGSAVQWEVTFELMGTKS